MIWSDYDTPCSIRTKVSQFGIVRTLDWSYLGIDLYASPLLGVHGLEPAMKGFPSAVLEMKRNLK